MLFKVEKPQYSGLYRLDEVLQIFFENLFADTVPFDTNLFPGYFGQVLIDSTKTHDCFKEVYDNYQLLQPESKTEFQEIYNNQRNALEGLADIDYEIREISAVCQDIWKACKELTKYLYTTTIGLQCFTALGNIATSMNEHYQAYKDLNGNVCCFCGLQEYQEERDIEVDEGMMQWRASYDHYLPKKHYPFLSVNFDNLFPCCSVCNEKAKKELDTLYEGNQRVVACNPYIEDRENNLTLELDIEYRTWDLFFSNKSDIENAKNRNWDRLFKIKSRANKRINDFFDQTWLSPLLMQATTIEQARERLNIEAARLRQRIPYEREAYYKVLAFENLLEQGDSVIKSYMDTSNQIYQRTAAIL